VGNIYSFGKIPLKNVIFEYPPENLFVFEEAFPNFKKWKIYNYALLPTIRRLTKKA